MREESVQYALPACGYDVLTEPGPLVVYVSGQIETVSGSVVVASSRREPLVSPADCVGYLRSRGYRGGFLLGHESIWNRPSEKETKADTLASFDAPVVGSRWLWDRQGKAQIDGVVEYAAVSLGMRYRVCWRILWADGTSTEWEMPYSRKLKAHRRGDLLYRPLPDNDSVDDIRRVSGLSEAEAQAFVNARQAARVPALEKENEELRQAVQLLVDAIESTMPEDKRATYTGTPQTIARLCNAKFSLASRQADSRSKQMGEEVEALRGQVAGLQNQIAGMLSARDNTNAMLADRTALATRLAEDNARLQQENDSLRSEGLMQWVDAPAPAGVRWRLTLEHTQRRVITLGTVEQKKEPGQIAWSTGDCDLPGGEGTVFVGDDVAAAILRAKRHVEVECGVKVECSAIAGE